jgi:hypothetical protein
MPCPIFNNRFVPSPGISPSRITRLCRTPFARKKVYGPSLQDHFLNREFGKNDTMSVRQPDNPCRNGGDHDTFVRKPATQ